jgi:selenocysteine-specific elongation factor
MARLIGTAGHVDHGKTTLIRVLTGIDTDRLPDEKRRGMTLDLGFAHITLPDGSRAGIVDVPGHERLITNMLAGAGGVDVALLCVAADAGVMPQTREHLQILALLPVVELTVALTRCDLAEPEVRELAIGEIRALLAETRFGAAPITPVSAVTGEGLGMLRETLAAALARAEAKPQPDHDGWFLPVDRVFTVKGHGTVVTGTLHGGAVRVGEEAAIEPDGRRTRIRRVHSHDAEVECAQPGMRVALNLARIEPDEVARGSIVGASETVFATVCLDAQMRWMERPAHGRRVRVASGTEEVLGRVFFGAEESDVAQFRLERPMAMVRNAALIVRQASPMELLGGGAVIAPVAKPRRRRDAVKVAAEGSDADRIRALLVGAAQGSTTEFICERLGKAPPQLGDAFAELKASGAVVGFAGLWLGQAEWDQVRQSLAQALAARHAAEPTLPWQPREAVVRDAGWRFAGKPLDRMMAAWAETGEVAVQGTGVRQADFRVQLNARQRELLTRVQAELNREPVNTPSTVEIARALAVPEPAIAEILRVGEYAGEIIAAGEGVFYEAEQWAALVARLRANVTEPFTAAAARDALGTTRKYIIPILETTDRLKLTERRGDTRRFTG